MKTTPNLGLKKPDQEDFYNVDDFNYNADKLDEEVARRIINAGGVPSIQAGLDSEKPAPGTAGRLYVATDTQMIYRDTGTAWQKVGAVKWDDIEGKPDLALASDLAAHLADNVKHITDAERNAWNAKETPSGAQSKVDTHASSKQTHGISGGYYIAKTSRSDQLPAWNDIQGKPSTYPPAAHTHPPADITPQGAGSGLNADTVRGETPDQLRGFRAGDIALKAYTGDTYQGSDPPNTWYLVDEVIVYNGGTLRVKFGLYIQPGQTYTIYGQIYRNGTPVGTLRSLSGTGTPVTTFTEDIGGWSPGDRVQLMVKSTSTFLTYSPIGLYVDRLDSFKDTL